jgi:hypothetical protein
MGRIKMRPEARWGDRVEKITECSFAVGFG